MRTGKVRMYPGLRMKSGDMVWVILEIHVKKGAVRHDVIERDGAPFTTDCPATSYNWNTGYIGLTTVTGRPLAWPR